MFKEIDIRDVKLNMTKAIADDWMLVSAGDEADSNMMTASWGLTGELWGEDVAVCFIRPQRHTLKYVEDNKTFALSFFDGEEKAALNFCGSKSGRDYDKAKETGLKKIFSDGTVYFEQAKLVIICEKIAVSQISKDAFVDPAYDSRWYAEDYHKIFVGKIIKVLQKED